jgi:hypothetical protein
MNALDDILGGGAPKPPMIAITAIRTDGGTQMRAKLDDPTVFEYTQAMIQANGWGQFPAVIAYYDGAVYWLGDGFHRVAAYRDAFPVSTDGIPCEVRAGTRRDAILHAAGANANHGVRRTQADKERAVDTLLRDNEWTQWSDTEIARRCAVDAKTVGNHRRKLAATMEIPESTMRKGADGRTTNTANNGRKPAPAPSPEQRQYASQVAVAAMHAAAVARLEAAGIAKPAGEFAHRQPAASANGNPLPADLAGRGWELRQVAGVGKWYCNNSSGPRATGLHSSVEDAIAQAYTMQRDLAWEAQPEPEPEDYNEAINHLHRAADELDRAAIILMSRNHERALPALGKMLAELTELIEELQP